MGTIRTASFLALLVAAIPVMHAAKLAAQPGTAKTNPADKGTPPEGAGKKGKAKARFTVGKATTYVEGPLDQDGRVDYAAALNQRMSKGVTPENNANVLLWKAMGPRPQDAPKMPPEYFRMMGMDSPPDEGEYFIDAHRYAKENPRFVPAGEGDNAYTWLARVTGRPWAAKDYPEVAAWLKRNERPLALVVEATRRTQYYSPLVPPKTEKGPSGLLKVLLPGVQPCRWFAHALAVRAMMHVGDGNVEDAWSDLLACHRLGRLVGRGGPTIEAIVGFSIDGVACQRDVVFLESARQNARQLAACLRDLRALPPLPDLSEKVDLCERFMILDIFMMCERYGLEHMESLSGGAAKDPDPVLRTLEQAIDWDPALETANRWCDRAVAALRETDRQARMTKLSSLETDLKAIGEQAKAAKGQKLTGKAAGRAIGDVLISRLMPAGAKLQDVADRARQIQDNVAVAFALSQYRLDHDRYPEGIDVLAPRYLEKVPGDLFSGKALVYRAVGAGYLFYSVGINGRDEDGRGPDDVPRGDDLSVRMPASQRREN